MNARRLNSSGCVIAALALALMSTAHAQDAKPQPAPPQPAPPQPAKQRLPTTDRLAPPADPAGISRLKLNPLPIQQQQAWAGQLAPTPITPAPEVVRLWSDQTRASARITSHDLSAVAELDARQFAIREAASTRLRAPTVTAEVIFAILAQGDLSVEQRERLLTIAQEKVLALPRGALGLRMQPSGDARNPGVEVLLLLPGMPAEKVLKIGDRIEKIDGKALATSSDLVEIIQSKMPGESVRLSIARQQRDDRAKPKIDPAGGFIEDRMEFEVALTSAIDLDKFEDRIGSPLRSVVLERRLLALREAQVRFAPATARVITPPPSPKKQPAAKADPIQPPLLDD